MQILKLTNGGMPSAWVDLETAACCLVKGLVNWSLGESMTLLRGGLNRQGSQSHLEIPAIIAVSGAREFARDVPMLTNQTLFRRDGYRCLYCGGQFTRSELTRDHVIPRGQGGLDVWTNVVAACRDCNHRKGCRTPEQSGMPLLEVPFTPNRFEFMYLANRHICGDQMEYLKARFTEQRCWETSCLA